MLDSLEEAYKNLLFTTIEPMAYIVPYKGAVKKVVPPLISALILSGSFNPIHKGHIALVQHANLLAKKDQVFMEISLKNADKGGIPLASLKERIKAIHEHEFDVLLTNLPLFTDKSKLLQESGIVIGYDTFIRIVDKKYYNNSAEEMERRLLSIAENKCQFYVGGRLCSDKFEILNEDAVPIPSLHKLFVPIPDFRLDISSTEIRTLILSKSK